MANAVSELRSWLSFWRRRGLTRKKAIELGGSIDVLTGCVENRDCTKREKNQSENTVAPAPGQARPRALMATPGTPLNERKKQEEALAEARVSLVRCSRSDAPCQRRSQPP